MNSLTSGESSASYVAFFDVDETLISFKSMLSFLNYVSADLANEFRAAQASVKPGPEFRALCNRLYYRSFAGITVDRLEDLGRAWFHESRATLGEAFYLQETLAELNRHRANGANIVLVSGSCEPCLKPLVAELGVDTILCAQLRVKDMVYTGDLTGEPMIGAGKSKAASAYCSAAGIALANCHAYGDHISDLELLTKVGYPHVVRGNADLEAQAVRLGWPLLGPPRF